MSLATASVGHKINSMDSYYTPVFATLVAAVSIGAAPTTGTVPKAAAQSAASPPQPAANAVKVVPKAQLLFKAYDEASFKGSQATGRPTMLVFSQSAHPVWLKQAPILQAMLRGTERVDVDVFQIDMTEQALCQQYKAKNPGTIIVIKDGVERLRSEGMTTEPAIKKYLRLIPIL